MRKLWVHLYRDGTYAVNFSQAAYDLMGTTNCVAKLPAIEVDFETFSYFFTRQVVKVISE